MNFKENLNAKTLNYPFKVTWNNEQMIESDPC